MNQIILFLLTIYQNIISPLLHQILGVKTACRYQQSCSVYTYNMISKHGLRKGGTMALKRFMSCQPFSKAALA